MSTNCVFPPELEDQELLKYLDDPNANPETSLHIEKCSHCRTRAEALAHFQKQMTSRLFRSTCPSPMELGEYHLRMIPASQRLVVAQHVRECPHCMRELSELPEFLGDVVPRPGLLDPIKVLIAQLVSGREQAAVRGEAPVAMVFEVEDIVISLESQQARGGAVSLQGLIAADDQTQWTGAAVELQQDYLTSLISYVDELGSFSFSEIAPAPVQVTITSPAGIAVQTEKVKLTR